ncbi:hypothetical protein HY249_03275 [Candidatus Azambacteria bacterium]|nr:hypothetical protein [Candidatus Azambacteria bacterium]
MEKMHPEEWEDIEQRVNEAEKSQREARSKIELEEGSSIVLSEEESEKRGKIGISRRLEDLGISEIDISEVNKELASEKDALEREAEEILGPEDSPEGVNKNDIAQGLAGVGTKEAMAFRKKYFTDPTLMAKSFSTDYTAYKGVICRYGYEK